MTAQRWTGLLRRRALLAALAGALLGAGIPAGIVLFRAHRTLTQTENHVAAGREVRFTSARLDPRPPGGFEVISSPAVFRDAAIYQGGLYLCGPAGLVEHDAGGAVRARYQVGPDLPGPLVALAAGVAADSGEPELFAATAGEGLLAFNGRTFRQIRPDAPSYRKLTAVLPLATGRILLGTEKHGVLVYDGKRIVPFHPLLANVHVTALAGDESGLWVGTLDRGVLHWRGGKVETFGEGEGLPDPQVLSLAVAGDAAYAGTPMGVAEFRSGRFTRALAEGFFARSLLVRGDALLIGTLEEGIVEVPLAVARPRPARPSPEVLPGAVVRLLEVEGSIYALAADGLYAAAARGAAWQRTGAEDAGVLADRDIAALELDGSGRLWVGYFDRGVDILELASGRVSHVEDDHVFCVNRIVHDRDRGLTAVATANGLVLFDAAGIPRQVLGRAEGLIASQVADVLLRPGGMVVATSAGITFLDAGGTRSLYAFHGLVNNHVYSLALAGERMLAGTLGGLSIIEGDSVRASYTTANSGLPHNWITAIVPAGDEWFVGTYGAGVLRLDGSGRWHTFADLRTPFEVNMNAMLSTGAAVYAGSLANGLYVYDVASGRWSAVTAGLPSSNVTALAAGGGYLYVGTDNGLVRIPEQAVGSR